MLAPLPSSGKVQIW